jgi:hypothetical protein
MIYKSEIINKFLADLGINLILQTAESKKKKRNQIIISSQSKQNINKYR